jgi:hypothetical protein
MFITLYRLPHNPVGYFYYLHVRKLPGILLKLYHSFFLYACLLHKWQAMVYLHQWILKVTNWPFNVKWQNKSPLSKFLLINRRFWILLFYDSRNLFLYKILCQNFVNTRRTFTNTISPNLTLSSYEIRNKNQYSDLLFCLLFSDVLFFDNDPPR